MTIVAVSSVGILEFEVEVEIEIVVTGADARARGWRLPFLVCTPTL